MMWWVQIDINDITAEDAEGIECVLTCKSEVNQTIGKILFIKYG